MDSFGDSQFASINQPQSLLRFKLYLFELVHVHTTAPYSSSPPTHSNSDCDKPYTLMWGNNFFLFYLAVGSVKISYIFE